MKTAECYESKRMGAVLEPVGRVREELGYPIMVTPSSQFVGVQAAMNVILGARKNYRRICIQRGALRIHATTGSGIWFG